MAACSSALELVRSGFADDVVIAVEVDASTTVPVLTDGAFSAGTRTYGSRSTALSPPAPSTSCHPTDPPSSG
ncbi:hypothetical protein O1M63_25575 [Streptomyces mirabilis]|nr:hypothetical protein [Streptomyces mirabilis]